MCLKAELVHNAEQVVREEPTQGTSKGFLEECSLDPEKAQFV